MAHGGIIETNTHNVSLSTNFEIAYRLYLFFKTKLVSSAMETLEDELNTPSALSPVARAALDINQSYIEAIWGSLPVLVKSIEAGFPPSSKTPASTAQHVSPIEATRSPSMRLTTKDFLALIG